jgi:threonine synthase
LTTDYASLAASVMAPFIGDEIDANTLQKLCSTAYSTFRDPRVTPLVPLEANHWMLELFHGPTLAFKDVALQFLGQLFDLLLEQRDEHITIVGATSGDTGSAAIDGVKNCSRVKIVILYPEGTRSLDGEMIDFKRGVLLLVKKAKPTILPMALDGTFDAWPKGRKFPRLRGKVVCVCGEPMSGEELAKLDGAQALAAMRDAVARLHDEARAERRRWSGEGP